MKKNIATILILPLLAFIGGCSSTSEVIETNSQRIEREEGGLTFVRDPSVQKYVVAELAGAGLRKRESTDVLFNDHMTAEDRWKKRRAEDLIAGIVQEETDKESFKNKVVTEKHSVPNRDFSIYGQKAK